MLSIYAYLQHGCFVPLGVDLHKRSPGVIPDECNDITVAFERSRVRSARPQDFARFCAARNLQVPLGLEAKEKPRLASRGFLNMLFAVSAKHLLREDQRGTAMLSRPLHVRCPSLAWIAPGEG